MQSWSQFCFTVYNLQSVCNGSSCLDAAVGKGMENPSLATGIGTLSKHKITHGVGCGSQNTAGLTWMAISRNIPKPHLTSRRPWLMPFRIWSKIVFLELISSLRASPLFGLYTCSSYNFVHLYTTFTRVQF